jgi:hypothetical protein
MKVAFGSVSAGGTGTPEPDVTQSGGGPCAFVASQSGGNAGGATLSKFSVNTCRSQHSGHGSGVGVGPVASRILDSPQPSPSTGFAKATAVTAETGRVSPIARGELIVHTIPMLATVKKHDNTTARNRKSADVRFRFGIAL